MYTNEIVYNHILDLNKMSITFSTLPPPNTISHSISKYLYSLKNVIHKNEKQWSHIKIFTNTYEFIHTSYDTYNALSLLQPVSRSFYKLIEMNALFELKLEDTKFMKSMHIAEGPGGFIEALYHLKCDNKVDTTMQSKNICVGITLKTDNRSIPSWKKLKEKLKHKESLIFDDLLDNTGNLYNTHNFGYVYSKYRNSMHFITADGGFDFSKNYNYQEQEITKLLLCQSMYAIICQRRHGTFIMKVFDIFTNASIDILYFLSMFYETIHICKPFTSRVANSEKYVVCKNFKYSNTTHFFKAFENIFIQIQKNKDKYIERVLDISYNSVILGKIEEINAMIGQKQIENIATTISLIYNYNRHDAVEQYKKTNINKCIQWLIEHNIPYKVPNRMHI